jgi:hypothetical protein
VRRIAIAALVVLAAACRETTKPAPGPTPTHAVPMPVPVPVPDASPAGSTSCDRDDDCIVSNFAGCCACPQCSVAAPHPVTRAQEKLRQASCAVVDCDMGPCNVGGMCPPGEDASHFVAHCVDHACTMTHK